MLYPGSPGTHIAVMALLKIARMGHPVLRAVAALVDDPTAPWVRRLVEDMIETMEDAGGTGIAAPQVHESHRIVVFRVPEERITEMPGDSAQDLTVLVNPVVELLGQERAFGWEGCLSVPGLRGVVPRHLRVRYRGTSATHLPISRTHIYSWVPAISKGSAPITVTTQDGTSAGAAFTVEEPWWKFW